MQSKPFLPQPEVRRLIARAQAGDQAALRKVTEHNLAMVYQIAKRFGTARPHEDLMSDGLLGLTKAIMRFDLNRGTQFSSFAWPYIDGSMKWKAQPFEARLDDTVKGTDDLLLRDTIPDPAAGPEEISTSSVLREQMDDVIEQHLTSREQQVVRMIYGFYDRPYSFVETAEEIGISNTRVHQILHAAHRKLARLLADQREELLAA